jgi:DNA-binding beta-propeller fold protein YncE
MWIVEMVSGNRLLKVDGGGTMQHVAGQLKAGDSGDGGQAIRAQFNGPHNLAILPDDNVLIADTWNGRVRVVDVKARIVSTLEGWRAPAGKEKGNGPYCITLNFEGTKLYIADLLQVHELDLATHKSKVIAGNGKRGKPEDGAVAIEAPLSDPRAVAPDRQGNVYILERGGNALRVVDKTGHIRTVVNASGKKGGEGDGGPALEATMNGPKHLCVDKDDSVIIADAEAHLVRRYVPAIRRLPESGDRRAVCRRRSASRESAQTLLRSAGASGRLSLLIPFRQLQLESDSCTFAAIDALCVLVGYVVFHFAQRFRLRGFGNVFH